MFRLQILVGLVATSCNAPPVTSENQPRAESKLPLSAADDSVDRFESFTNVVAGQSQTVPWRSPLAATVVAEKTISAANAAKYQTVDFNTSTPLVPVIGAYGDGENAVQFKLLMQPQAGSAEPPPEGRVATVARDQSTQKVSPRTLTEMARGTALPVTIRLDEELASSLVPALPVDNWVRFQESNLSNEEIWTQKEALIVARRAEAWTKQKPLRDWLTDHSADGASGYWLVNAMTAVLTPQQILDVAALEYVRWISYVDPAPLPSTSSSWDGTYVRSIGYLSASSYLNAGLHGGISNSYNENGRVRIAVMDDLFDTTSPAWRDGITTASRVIETWACSSTGCTPGVATPPPGVNPPFHGTLCTSAAAADLMDGQMLSLTSTARAERSSSAEEAQIIMISTGNIAASIRSLERAVASHADVFTQSRGGSDYPCDGNYDAWDDAVYNAQQAGTLVVSSAGNEGQVQPVGTCGLSGLAEVPSILTVGALIDPGVSYSYSSTPAAAYSSEGGVNITTNSQTYYRALTGVDLMVPGAWAFPVNNGGMFGPAAGGTSLAAPQVAAAAVNFKHWAISKGWASVTALPGWMYANLLAMTDRKETTGVALTSGFSYKMGGGRMQMRLFEPSDHTSGNWRWETAWYTMSSGQVINHLIGGSGVEPSFNVVKAYALWLENDGVNVADIVLSLRDNNCVSPSNILRYDLSRDIKKMVYADSSASNKALCAQLNAYSIPAGTTRQVMVVVYYSTDTVMR